MTENIKLDTDRKSYNQVCPMSSALDIIGDRWTILILRELLGGSARFYELRDGLPGIATNLLTERLRRLEADGLVRQIDAHNTVLYALTERGAAIRPTLEELGFWGARAGRVAPAKYERSIRAVAMALQAILVRAGDALPPERMVIELEIDGEYLEVVLDQRPTVTARLAIDPDARVRTTHEDISAVLRGRPIDDSTFTRVSGNDVAMNTLIATLDWRK
ncbi:MAG: transcriptional regulator [Chloroflexi bacterium]|nr:MAG: transcriptional regulator [Chloroflexota bacterium]MBL1192807.1 transcriptional regulator [Chloroflexota bacterium]NOH10101.1 helix-turn-helix transcriptional regulator [Chloroflexota bacterium]